MEAMLCWWKNVRLFSTPTPNQKAFVALPKGETTTYRNRQYHAYEYGRRTGKLKFAPFASARVEGRRMGINPKDTNNCQQRFVP
eukprot:scaffold4511_cov171-Amphora_coffeaeformis.AAC.1